MTAVRSLSMGPIEIEEDARCVVQLNPSASSSSASLEIKRGAHVTIKGLTPSLPLTFVTVVLHEGVRVGFTNPVRIKTLTMVDDTTSTSVSAGGGTSTQTSAARPAVFDNSRATIENLIWADGMTMKIERGHLTVDNMVGVNGEFEVPPDSTLAYGSAPGAAANPPNLHVHGLGNLELHDNVESLVLVDGTSTAQPLVVVSERVSVLDIQGVGRFDLGNRARLRGHPKAGFTLIDLKGGEDADIQNVDLYEIHTGAIPALADARRVLPRWSDKGTMNAALLRARTVGEQKGPTGDPMYASNAHRWASLRDIIYNKSSRGFDRAIASYLLHDSRRIDMNNNSAVGAHRLVEYCLLGAACLFGYGCRILRPALVALVSAWTAAWLIELCYDRPDQKWFPQILETAFDLLASPVAFLHDHNLKGALDTALQDGGKLPSVIAVAAWGFIVASYAAIVTAVGRHLWRRSATDSM